MRVIAKLFLLLDRGRVVLANFVRPVMRTCLGEVSWSPPIWLASLRHALKDAFAWMHREPRQAAILASALVVAMGSAYATWFWYRHRPMPQEVAFTVQAPERTCYECDPQGKPHPLLIRFGGSVAKLESAGKVIQAQRAGIGLRPSTAGEWRWRDDETLEFQPKTDWPIAEQYKVSFARKGFTAPQIHLNRYDAEFDSPAFSAQVAANEFYQDPVLASDKKIVTTLKFTHTVAPADLERRISLKLYEKLTDRKEREVEPAPKFTVTYDKLKLQAYVHSENLAVPSKEGRVEIKIAEGVHAAAGGNSTKQALVSTVIVPGLYSLGIGNVNLTVVRDERDNPSQALMIATTHSVTEPEMTARVKAWLLPEKNPDAKVQMDWERVAGNHPYRWSANLVTEAALAQATPLPLSYVANEREHVELHSFKLKAQPHQQIYLRVDKGLTSFGGYLMPDAADRVLDVPEYPKELRIAHQGSLLALSGKRKLTVFARDIPAIEVRIARLLPDQLQHLVTQAYGEFSKPQFNYNFDETNIAEIHTQIVRLPQLEPGSPHYASLNIDSYLNYPGASRQGIFLLNVRAYDPATKQVISAGGVQEQTMDSRLVVLTDLGLLAKKSIDGSQDVFVQSIATGEPLSGIAVDVIGRNGEAVLTESTDATGHVRFPSLGSFGSEKAPVLYLAHKEGDSSFLPINKTIRDLDLSRFDVGGIDDRAARATLTAYLFSDRGIYRPGDEIRAGAIVKTQDWRKLPAGLPLRVEVTDPRGVAVKRETIAMSAAGFEDIRYQTRAASPAGAYNFNVYVIQDEYRQELIGSIGVRVQEFLPDRLRMNAHFSSEAAEGWVTPDDLKAQIKLENLFGTPASDRRVKGEMKLSPSIPSFAAYRDYNFRDPQAAKQSFDENLTEQKTDDQGTASFDLNLKRFAKATYRVSLVLQGFEADGGRGVTTEAAQLVSNLPFLVGWKADGRLDYIARGAPRQIEFVALDSKLRRTTAAGLKLRRIERRYVSMLLKQDNGTFKYESRMKETSIDERSFEVPAEGAMLALDASAPGNFSYVLIDDTGQVFARVDYTIAGAANVTRSLEKNAELQLVLNKKDYASGETIEMQIQAPYTGAGLITIERDKVYAWRWFKTTTTSSVQKITLPNGLEGGAYVSVSFVRDPGSEEIYTSPLSYGVQPFSISLDARKNAVQLTTPERLKPGEALTLRYRTEKPARIALFAVDEGILQVARYKTPAPLEHFFQKRALTVRTQQILDLILPEFREAMLSAPGGDAGSLLGANLNPFKRKTDKPVAWWSGIVDAGESEKELSWIVPDTFNGTLRIMAVAVSDDSIGVAERSAIVRGDFVLSPNAPLTVTPGDEFDVSVGVANNVLGSGANAQITVGLNASTQLEIVGPKEQTLKIAELRESSASFHVKARDELGSATLQFTAALGDKSAKLDATLSVRPATPYMSSLSAGHFRGNAKVALTRNLYPQYRTLQASVSPLPLALAHGLVSYLGRYPYSCTEQLVSQALPAIVLTSRPEFGYVRELDGANFESLIAELRARQTGDGAYRYWPGGVQVVDFVSAYAQQVLLEAAERGQPVPKDLLDAGNRHLRELAMRDGNTLDDERTAAYAIYLLARQGVVAANQAAALQKRLNERYAKEWPSDIVAAYLASAYQLMKQQSLANRTIAGVRVDGKGSYDRWHGPMTSDAELLYLLSKHFPERLARLPDNFLENLVQRVQSGEYQSLSAATTVLALDAYANVVGSDARVNLRITAVGAGGSRVLSLPAGLFPRVDFAPGNKELRFDYGSELPAFYLVNQSGFDRTPPTTAITQGLEVIREYVNDQGETVSAAKVGEEVTVRVKFRAIGRAFIEDAVLVDLLPGGFDLVVPNAPASEQRYFSAQPAAGENETEGRDEGVCVCAFLSSRPRGFPYFADLREDRVVIYGRALDRIQEFSYRIKATNAGRFATPPAYGESMYDARIRARSTAGRIMVEKP